MDTMILNGREYQVINQNGEIKLKTYYSKQKMWVTLNFAKERDEDVIKNIKEVTEKILLDAI